MAGSDYLYGLVGLGAVAIGGFLVYEWWKGQSSEPRSWICNTFGIGCPTTAQDNAAFANQLKTSPEQAIYGWNLINRAKSAFAAGNYQTYDTGTGIVGITPLGVW